MFHKGLGNTKVYMFSHRSFENYWAGKLMTFVLGFQNPNKDQKSETKSILDT